MTEPSLPEKIVALHARLGEAGIPHAFGGALALAYYAEPRATDDVDLNLFLPPSGYAAVSEALAPLGVGGSERPADLERDGQTRVWWGRTPLDLFFSYDELHEEMRREARMYPFGDMRLPILAPEHLLVCKAVFDRPKDWLDIEQMIVCVEELDTASVCAWLGRILGEGDRRSMRFEQMLSALDAAPRSS